MKSISAWETKIFPPSRLEALLFPGLLFISAGLHLLALLPGQQQSTTLALPAPQKQGQIALRLSASASSPSRRAETGALNSDVVSRHNQSLQNSIVYPRIAQQYGWSGIVRLKVEVDRNGRAHAINVAQSSGFDVLDNTAIAAIQKHYFSDMTGSAYFTFIFRLRDD